MTAKKNTFSVDQIQQIEIGRNGNIMPRLRDLDQDTTLKGSLLKVLYPAIRVASVNVPVEPLEEIEETRVRNTMAKVVYKGVRYKLVGASGSAVSAASLIASFAACHACGVTQSNSRGGMPQPSATVPASGMPPRKSSAASANHRR